MALYRRLYQPSERHPQPQATLCIWALAADTDEEAAHLALSRDRWRIDRGRGVLGPLQSPDDDRRTRLRCGRERRASRGMRARAFVGSRRHGRRADPRASPTTFQLDEVVINTWAHDPAVRRRSYALIAARVRPHSARAAVGEAGATGTRPDRSGSGRSQAALSGSCTAKNRSDREQRLEGRADTAPEPRAPSRRRRRWPARVCSR